MPHRVSLSRAQQTEFLDVLARCGTVRAACDRVSASYWACGNSGRACNNAVAAVDLTRAQGVVAAAR
jgi:hypothetical protein